MSGTMMIATSKESITAAPTRSQNPAYSRSEPGAPGLAIDPTVSAFGYNRRCWYRAQA